MVSLLLFMALACDPQVGSPAAGPTQAESPAGWAERFALVRADIDQLEAAHAAKDKDAAVASWEQAYRQRFELLIELPAGASLEPHQRMAVEYAFGRLRDGLDSPRPEPVQAALAHLREQLDALEPAVAQLPVPAH